MSKAFVKEHDDEDEDDFQAAPPLPGGHINYITRTGHLLQREEFERLVKVERPALVQIVSWAAGNGDRSENGDYIYGKKRLREIDRRIRYLMKCLENAVIVDPLAQENLDQAFFGATVTIVETDAAGNYVEATYQIVGVDEADAALGRISWISPLARALLKAREGDVVRFQSPAGIREIEVTEIVYR